MNLLIGHRKVFFCSTPFRELKSPVMAEEGDPLEAARERLYGRIKEGRFTFNIPPHRLPSCIRVQGNISEGVKEVIRNLLQVDTSHRWTSRDLLSCEWILTGA